MVTYLLLLKGTNKDLASLEFEILFKTYYGEDIKLKQIRNTLFFFSTNKVLTRQEEFLKRLSFTNTVSKLLFKGKIEEYSKTLSSQVNPCMESFALRIHSSFANSSVYKEKGLDYFAKAMWTVMKKPKIDLNDPQCVYHFHYDEEKNEILCSEEFFENSKDYLQRMPTQRPFCKPYTIKSDLARASVNMLGLKTGLICDPFCGTGAILLEAQSMGFEVVGNDISYKDLMGYRANSFHFFSGFPSLLTLSDSRELVFKEKSIGGLVTDIPYGKSSRKLGTELYEQFLLNAKKYLKNGARLVVIYANFLEFEELVKKHYKVLGQAEEYINKSMTRRIIVAENC
ncbi:MAG: hypothetical protein H6500_01095 [Candidatus Woesearchaeota archaeon]|nr:hypothetical protein [Nanoarchaeota archaeon]USN44428.1 MAG: hypothetical protein H6500_01095 [Candidatus Woesearchaeota archaeon]